MYSYNDIRKINLDIIDSTQSYLLKNSFDFCSMTFVSTKIQTKGHGRMKRTWFSSNNSNLMFSFIIKDKYYLDRFDSLSLLIGVALYNALKGINIPNVKIKWPNDVYVNNKKIAGIILESISYNELDSIVIGVGLNVNMKEFNGLKATSIYNELNKEYDVEVIKDLVYINIIDTLNEFEKDNKSYLKVINDNNYLLNKKVIVYPNGNRLEAIAGRINDDNSLEVIADNKSFKIKSDEVFDLHN